MMKRLISLLLAAMMLASFALADEGGVVEEAAPVEEPVAEPVVEEPAPVAEEPVSEPSGSDDIYEEAGEGGGYHSIEELPAHVFDEMRHFFTVYKNLEDKTTVVNEVQGPAEARAMIQHCLDAYIDKFCR